MGVKFHPGALYSLGIVDDSSSVLDTVLNTKREITFDTQGLIELAKNDSQQCIDQLDALLLPWLLKAKDDSHSQLTGKILSLLTSTPISKLSEKLSCSQRTLERSFNKTTGLTLKQCQSMNKLDALLEHVHRQDAVG